MKPIDVTVPLDATLPIYPGNTPFTGAEHLIARGVTVAGVDDLTVEEFKKPGAPARVLLRRN